MKVKRSDVQTVSEHYGLGLTSGQIKSYLPRVKGLLGSWDVVERLYEEQQADPPQREWARPSRAANPLGAWAVTADITGPGSGLLTGRRVAIKDNIAVAGLPMSNGSRTLKGFVPRRDATVVQRLLAAGATIAGKSVCEDLCFSGGSHTSQPGPVRNPWDRSRSAGGSSSGNGALVASGAADLAVGGDQGGSVRIPAAFCGIVGHKPTHGLVPYTGAFPIETTIDHLGPMTRTVADAALMLRLMAGDDDGRDPRQRGRLEPASYAAALERGGRGLRVGVVTEGFGWANSEPEVDDCVREATDVLGRAGMSVQEVSIPWHRHGPDLWNVISVEGGTFQMVDGNAYGMNVPGLYDPDLIAHYGRTWRKDPSAFSQTVKLVLLAGRHALTTRHGRHYAMARNLVPTLTRHYDQALSSYDVLVMPTLTIRASALPEPDAPMEEILDRALEMLANTCPFDVTGHPACSVPAGVVDGLPVGLMIVGRRGDDGTVLRAAHAFEQEAGGFPAPPEG